MYLPINSGDFSYSIDRTAYSFYAYLYIFPFTFIDVTQQHCCIVAVVVVLLMLLLHGHHLGLYYLQCFDIYGCVTGL